jgi:hypothetical protein
MTITGESELLNPYSVLSKTKKHGAGVTDGGLGLAGVVSFCHSKSKKVPSI